MSKTDYTALIAELADLVATGLESVQHNIVTVTLPASKWSGRAQIVNDVSFLADSSYCYFVCSDADCFTECSDAGVRADKSATWTITSVIVSIPTQKNIPTYDGTDKTPEWDNFDTENCTVQVTPAANAGEHSAIFTLLRGMWSDGSTTNKTIAWTVKRAPIAALPTQTNVPTYDGNPKIHAQTLYAEI